MYREDREDTDNLSLDRRRQAYVSTLVNAVFDVLQQRVTFEEDSSNDLE
jgi:hypothetical protein